MTLPQWMEEAKAEHIGIVFSGIRIKDDPHLRAGEWRTWPGWIKRCPEQPAIIPRLLEACRIMHAALERAHRLAERMGDKLELEASVYTIQDDDYEGWYIRDVAQAALDEVGKL